MKKSKSRRKIREKKSLIISNMGDTVVIKNRSAVGGGALGVILMMFFLTLTLCMRVAWKSPLFWGVIIFLFLCSAYWFATTAFAKIVLDSPKLLMTVYNPFKAVYRFKDINYVDRQKSKPKDGYVMHTVNIYIGNGKRRVRIDTFSSAEADEIELLVSGMLDCGAMEYPEGNEEPFNYEKKENKEEKPSPFSASLKARLSGKKKPESTGDDIDEYNANLIRKEKSDKE